MKKVLFSLVTLLLLSVSGIAQTTFTKITSASDLEAGANYLIVAHHDDFGALAMGYQKTNNRNAVVVAESGDAITVTLGTDPTSATDVFQFTLGGGAGAWTFFDEVKEGYLYAASSSGNQLKTQTTLDANGQWSITFNSDGTAEVVAQGENTRNNIRFNPNTSNGDPLFSCYLESSNVDTRVSFYKAGGTAEPDHAYVDLGLPSGTLWATCNVGADTPEGDGDHFAWGETQPKDNYGWNTYQYCNGSGSSLTKYCSNSTYGYNGFTDNLTTLLPEDDAATVNWGDGWRMPTEEEWQELFQNTPYTLSTQNGVNGWLFTASNGNSLFLPFPGYLSNSSTYFAGNYGYYWSSSLCTPQPNYAYYLYCGSDGDYGFYSNFGRGRGLSVRAVRSGSPVLSYTINVMANPEEGGTVTGDGTYNQGATCTLTATANNGYSFTNWTKNGTEVSTNHSYSFTVTEDATFVANFSALDDDPLTYSINDDGVSVTVTGHIDGTAATGSLIIPETKTIDGVTYTVTGIGNNAFKDCTGLTGNLVIPNSVITIGDYAFQGCFAMQGSLTIGTSVTEIWKEAFQNCGFHTVNFNATGCTHMCTIIGVDHYFVFSGCNNLTTLNIGENVQIIPDYAFYECSGLTGNLTIPNSVVSIGQSAFGYCNGFTGDLIIPNSVTTIGGYAFLNCSGFTGALTIGTSVTEIGVGAFGGCYNFTTVNFNASNCTTMGGDGSSNNPFYSYNNPTGPTNAILNIGENVQTIPEYAFYGCSGLTGALNLPESLVSIGHEAFMNCQGLTGNLVIPNSVTTIGNRAFSGCSGFTGLTLGESLVSIGEPSTYNYEGPFKNCSGFTGSLTIPNSVTFIKSGSFNNCSGFTSLTIGNSVTEIGGSAFYNCSGFTGSLTIPNSVTTIGESAFQSCSGFTGDLTIGNSVTSIEQWAFQGCNGFTGSLTIGNSVTTIGNGAFKDCSGFTGSLTIPNSVTEIGSSAFRNCSGFNSLTIGNSVTSIWNYAFYDCSGLSAINILAENPPETSIYLVFFNVSNNIPVTVPCGTSGAYQNATGWSSFTNIQENCDPLTYSINDDGVSVTVTGHVDGTGATGPLIIPETKTIDGVTYTVTAIKNDAFRNYRGLTGDLVIPNSVVTIGSRAFMNCSGFTGLTLGNSLTTISIGAFSNCNSFTGSLILPESLTIILGNAFQNCSGFTGDLTIPAGVTSLGGAFAGCSGFTSLTMLPTVPPVNNPFGSSPYDIPVTVPCGSWSLYRYAYDWTGFTSIQEDCSGTYEVMATANPTEGGSVIFGTEGETLFADSFGSYTAGSTIAAEAAAVSHDWWTTWSGQTGGDDDGMVVDYGGTRCGHLTYGNDQVLLLNKESGIYEIEFDILVPEGKNAFFSFLHQFDETVNEAVYCHLHMTNVNYQNTITPYHGSIRAGNYNLTDIPCVFDAWMHFRFHVDMDADIARCYYTAPDSEEMLLCQWPWSWNSNTAAYTDSGLAAMDFWPPMDEATSEYYIDNFSLKQYEVGNTMLPGNHFAPGSTCTLTAVANEDYTFSNWTENGNMVSTDATYSFTVTDDRTLVANFNQATPTNYVITATANPTEGGTVTIGGMAHLLFDSFEMYNLGSKLSVAATTVGHDWWTTWSNYPGSLEDGVVANYNGTQCAHFTYGNDQILLLGNAVSGLYDLQFDVLVPNGKNGYFNVMHHFAGSQSSWAMECYFHMTNDGFTTTSAPGHGTVNAGSIGTCDLPCVYDEWMHYRIHIDIDNDVAQLYFNVFGQPEVKYAEWQWSLNIFGTEVVDGTIEAVDFYPPQNYSTSEFYVDNVRFSQFNGRYSTANNDGHIFAEMNSERDAVRNYEYYEYGATCTLNAMANEGYSFVNWTKNDSVVSTNNSYSFTVTEDATFVANFIIDQSEITQTTAFTEGWNWWSTYIEMAGIDGLGMLENGLGTNGISIKSQSNGYTEFYEDYDLWYGSLESINNESSYLVKTSAPCQVSMTGAATVPSQHPITVDADGWTWIGYPVAYDMGINVALDGLASIEGDMLKAQEGYAEFYDGYGWYGSLETLIPGMGYMYKSTNTSPTTFTYPDNGRAATHDNITAKDNHWVPMASAYPFNMTVTAVVELDGEELRSDRYELAAFANGESRGSVRLMYVEPIDRYVAFLTIAGEETADLSFALYDTETSMECLSANEVLAFEANATVGKLADPFVVSFRGTTGMDELANSLRVYPNPVNAGERFSIGLNAESKAPVRVEIVNALGVVVSVETSTQAPASVVAPVTAGVYTLRVTVEGKGTAVRKLVVK